MKLVERLFGSPDFGQQFTITRCPSCFRTMQKFMRDTVDLFALGFNVYSNFS